MELEGITTDDIPGVLLTGAVKVDAKYYIATMPKQAVDNAGIFEITSDNVSQIKYSGTVKSIIASGNSVIAVTADHILYGTDFNNTIRGVRFTGGMALWNDGTNKILILGVQGSGFSCGYREVPLDGSGNINGGLYLPGDTSGGRATTIDPNIKETAAIRHYDVTALSVIPSSNSRDGAGRPIIIASTQKNGLWSYRVRGSRPQWNGEDNGN